VVKASDAVSIGAEVASVCRKLAMYEWMEVQSLLEMALWRMKVKEQSILGLHDQFVDSAAMVVLESDERLTTARENFRMNCGINLVLTNVMPFLDRATT